MPIVFLLIGINSKEVRDMQEDSLFILTKNNSNVKHRNNYSKGPPLKLNSIQLLIACQSTQNMIANGMDKKHIHMSSPA